MSRVQLALNVGNLDEAIAFYTKLFQTEPAKVREGYANFAIAEPPLKLVLIAGGGTPGTTPGSPPVVPPVVPGSGTVPEPASWAMLLAGFGTLGGVMRWQRRATA